MCQPVLPDQMDHPVEKERQIEARAEASPHLDRGVALDPLEGGLLGHLRMRHAHP